MKLYILLVLCFPVVPAQLPEAPRLPGPDDRYKADLLLPASV
ncbi:MAG: hypothetical protein ACM336_16695 [Acidobacteriota bacterium]